MTITTEQALEIAKKAGIWHLIPANYAIDLTRALNLAHQDGQRAMRERAAIRGRIAQLESNLVDVEIRNLEIT